jgi:hypothetical protein
MHSARFKINSRDFLLTLVSFVFLLILSRQVPFDSYSSIMNISLVMIFFAGFKMIYAKLIKRLDFLVFFLLMVLLLISNFSHSIFQLNDVGNATRFGIIILLISLAYFVFLPKQVITIFLYLYIFHAIVLILFEFYLTTLVTVDNYLPIRFFFQNRGWGDVFTYNGWFYRIQIKGNALLPVAFFTTFFYKIPRINLVRFILLTGCIIAGNVAFLISIAVFLIGFNLKSTNTNMLIKRLSIVSLIVVLMFIPVYAFFIKETLELKQESLSVRSDQISVLMDDLTEHSLYTLFGRGLGHTIEVVSPYRDYRGDTYFELQSLYILNQIGVLGFAFLLFYNIYVSFNTYKIGLFFVYFCYVLYAFTNPYIFDTNHVAVILILNTLQRNEI